MAWALALVTCAASPGFGQTISGTLLDRDTDAPIALGYVALLTEKGDSVDAVVTDSAGRFTLDSPEPGVFKLLASALGHSQTMAGLFELGSDGEMTVEFRLAAEAITLDGLLVQAERVAREPALARVGFYDRIQRGFGRFITPDVIAKSAARTSSDLLLGVPGVSVQQSWEGDVVKMQGLGAWCTPRLYLDGIQLSAESATMPFEMIAPLSMIEAVEIYRRPAEVPIQYSIGQASGGADPSNPRFEGSCGVILIWTKK